MGNYKIISGDEHMFEPLDLWTKALGSKFGDRVPRIVRTEGGGDWWVTDGLKGQPISSGSMTGERFEGVERLSLNDLAEHVRPGAYDTDARVKDMAMDGVDASIIFPNAGFLMYSVTDSDLLNPVFGVYNDFIAEQCRTYPGRLNGVGMLTLDDIPWAIKEMERCQKQGLPAVMIPVYYPPDKSYSLPMYEPFWAAAQDLGMALCMHTGTIRGGQPNRPADAETSMPEQACTGDYWIRMSLGQLIFGGVFERYPELQVVSVEHELSWAPFFLQKLDYTYTQLAQREHWHRFGEDMLPSDYFHRNVSLGVQEDAIGIQLRNVIGVDNIQWGSDYPHQESTFPRSREILDEILADCTEDERAKIAGGNAARVYRLG